MRSISARVHLTFFAFSITVAVTMVVLLMIVNDGLETTMLQNDLDDEVHFLLTRHPQDQLMEWESAGIKIFYIPAAHPEAVKLPKVFEGLPLPFSGEVEIDEHTFLVRTSQWQQSKIFVARDISAFEEREASFQMILAIASMVMLLFTYFFAKFGSQRLTRPLTDLAQRIQGITAGKQMPRLPCHYQDDELLMIAVTFNAFLEELEAFVRREQSLTNLASHELRTPIAVVSGAVDILMKRDRMDVNDKKTVERIRHACEEMSSNVEMLLKLARRSEAFDHFEKVDVPALVHEVLNDLASRFAIEQRVNNSGLAPMTLSTDRTLLKMLLRNLIHNALQHTDGKVDIATGQQGLQVADHGAGLPNALRAQVSGQVEFNVNAGYGGLGLYIVALICEKLDWHIQATPREEGGTVVSVQIPPL